MCRSAHRTTQFFHLSISIASLLASSYTTSKEHIKSHPTISSHFFLPSYFKNHYLILRFESLLAWLLYDPMHHSLHTLLSGQMLSFLLFFLILAIISIHAA